MTDRRRWFAPGKMMWIGEYAVLDGAPAVVAAVDRGVDVVREGDADRCVVRTSLDPQPRSASPSGDFGQAASARLLNAVAMTLRASGVAPPAGRWFVDSSALSDDAKLGLGSSGAVAAALVAAWAPRLDADTALGLALEAHHAFQGRVGSGSDVIASALGGLVEVRRDRPPVRHRAIAGLDHVAIATGVAADTRVMVRRVRAWREARPTDAAPIMAALADAARAGVDAIANGHAGDWLAAVSAFARAERALTRASGVPVVSEVIDRALSAARSAGWWAKPSGAGGGDVVVAFAVDGDRAALDASVRDAGLTPISLALAPRGVLFADADGPSRT